MGFEKAIFAKDRLGSFCFLLVVLMCFGYTLSASTAAHLGVLDAERFNLIFRIIYPAISMFLLIGAFKHRKLIKLNRLSYIFLIFLIVYLIRYFYDVEIRGITVGRQNKLVMHAFSLANTFLPVIAIVFTARFSKFQNYLNLLYWFIVYLNIVLFLFVILNYGFNFQLFIARNSLDLDKTDKTRGVIGPITYSFTGEVLALLSLAKLLVLNNYNSKGMKLVYLFFVFLGVGNLLLGASRGPFVGFVLTSLVVVYYYLKNSPKVKAFYLKLFNWIIGILATIIILLKTLLKDVDFYILSRFATTFEKQQSGTGEHRNIQWNLAWDSFKRAPVFGEAFVVFPSENKFMGVDPHNVFLEVFMATGIFGSTLFFIAFFGLLFKTLLALLNGNKNYFFLSIIMYACVVSMAFSSNIFRGYRWMGLFVFLLIISYRQSENLNNQIKVN